jgi:GGDEF domain-containing protein
MDTRADWDLALRHEDARVTRYGRPAAVLVVRIRMPQIGAEDHVAARVGTVLREHARETDRVTRASTDRFHVLLPETAEAEADALAERLQAACARSLPGQPGSDLEILVAAAGPVRGGSLQDALRAAQARVAD